jgi:MOSC domain-containing protein YiiM
VPELIGIWRSPKRRELMEPLESARVFENEGIERCAHRRRDMLARVLRTGSVSVGDEIRLC